MSEGKFKYSNIDTLLHSPIRLSVISLLMNYEEVEFTFIKKEVGATDGNLNTHLAKLEAAGYIEVWKIFKDKKPVTLHKISGKGIQAFQQYVASLETLLHKRNEQ